MKKEMKNKYVQLLDPDIVRRANTALACLEKPGVPRHLALVESMQVYSGTLFDDLPGKIRTHMELHFLNINQISRRYRINDFKDYAKMSPADLEDCINRIKTISGIILEEDTRRKGNQ